MRPLIAAILLLVPLLVNADESVWLGPDRKQWPDTEFRKTKNDFAALLLVTNDVDWQRNWNTSRDTIPRFNQAGAVKVGEQLVILTFFVNPKTDNDKRAQVRCSIKVTKPNKTVAVNERGITCLEGELRGDPNYIRIAPAVINFVGERTDPRGEWVVDVEVEDVLRNTKLPLRTRFILQDGG